MKCKTKGVLARARRTKSEGTYSKPGARIQSSDLLFDVFVLRDHDFSFINNVQGVAIIVLAKYIF